MSQSESWEERERREAGAARTRFALRMFVPLLLSFIVIVFLFPALGIKGSLAAGILYAYILIYLAVQFLLIRWSVRARIRRLPGQTVPDPIPTPIGLRRGEEPRDISTQPKAVSEADLELCAHCGSAVSRKSG
ncbi:MAG TPA: hypothetical protein VFE96_09620, partial [Candidatus Bathyarchaeia archaeon]|nr:hypothetical protein [Candidatus Bathyarchaeia archaeon]